MTIKASRLWLGLVPAMTVPFITALLYFVILSENPISRAIYGGVKVFLLVWPIVAVRLIYRSPWPRVRLRDSIHRRAVPAGALLGAAIIVLIFVAMATPIGNVIRGSADQIGHKASQLGILRWYVPFALFLSVVHSLLEEYYWRWFVYGHLRKVLVPLPAIILSSVTFASHHVIIASQFFGPAWGLLLGSLIGLGGAAWCVMFEKQGTLAGAWISHMLVDLGVMAVGYQLLMTG